MRRAADKIDAEEAWLIVEAWLPEALEHVKRKLERMTWALEDESPTFDTKITLRNRVKNGFIEHDGEMFEDDNQSLTRFHRDLEEELLDAIVYAAMSERHLHRLKHEERARKVREAAHG